MRKRTCFLHVGPPKTGTSALQYVLSTSTFTGVLYPQAGRWSDGAHHELAFAFAGETRRGDRMIRSFEEIYSQLKHEIATHPDDDVILSSEGLYPSERGGSFLEVLQSDFAGAFDEFRVLITFRNYGELLASRYNQAVKDPVCAEHRDPNTYLSDSMKGVAYSPELKGWSIKGVPVTLVNYHPRETYLARMMLECGIIWQEPPGRVRRNTSMGPRALFSLLIANRLLDRFEDRLAFFKRLREERRIPIWEQAKIPFSPALLDRLKECMAEDMCYLRTHHGIAQFCETNASQVFLQLTGKECADIQAVCSGLPGYRDRQQEFDTLLAGYIS